MITVDYDFIFYDLPGGIVLGFTHGEGTVFPDIMADHQ